MKRDKLNGNIPYVLLLFHNKYCFLYYETEQKIILHQFLHINKNQCSINKDIND
jgi:predicted metallopeptidase